MKAADRARSRASSGRLHERAEHRGLNRGRGQVADDELDAERFGARAQHVDRLRKAASRRRRTAAVRARFDPRASPARGAASSSPRRRRSLRRAATRWRPPCPSDRATMVWKLSSAFEPALRDLRLVRRVRRVPAGILEHVPEDHARRDAVVVAEADVRLEQLVLRRESPAGRAGTRARAAPSADRAARSGGSAPESLRRSARRATARR